MFLLSLVLVLFSSYIITSIVTNKNKKYNLGIIYFLLIGFSQIVLSFEVLSLFSKISALPFLICNILFFVSALSLWVIKKFPLYKINIIDELKKIKKVLKRDKILFFLSFCFILFLFFEFITLITSPVGFGDAVGYYFPRATEWIQQGNISHFITPDSRELIMPVNLEFLYSWLFLYNVTVKLTPIFSYISMLVVLFVTYNFLGELGFCRRKRLWSVFVVSSFMLFGVMAYEPCADLFIGALILSVIYLFYIYLRKENTTALYFSTLAYALAIGTKTTALIALPSLFFILFSMTLLLKKESLKKSFLLYFGLLLLNFLVFSSYNYILNFIQFSNPISCQEQFLLNKFRGGFEGYISNLIKYTFGFFDASGIKNIDFYNNFITMSQDKVLGLFGMDVLSHTSFCFDSIFEFNDKIKIADCFLGVMGLLAFLPALICTLIRGLFIKSFKIKILSILAFSLIFNILLFSRVMVFTRFNYRYLITFVVIAIPVVVFSYIKSNKNLYKWLMMYFMFIYLFAISHTKPVALYMKYLNEKALNKTTQDFFNWSEIKNEEFVIYNYFISKQPCKIAMFSNLQKGSLFEIFKLRLKGFVIDRLLVEEIDLYNLKQYDYIIYDKTVQDVTLKSKKVDKNKLCTYGDYEANIITYEDNTTPIAVINCEYPEEYYLEMGFDPINDINLDTYKIVKRK